MGTLISFLIALLVFAVVVYCLTQVVSLFPGIPAPIKNIAIVIIGVILFVILLNILGVNIGNLGIR